MKELPAPIQQLIDRKLWPIALLLVAALAAVPMLLKSDETTEPLPTPVAAAPATEAADASIVKLSDAGKRDQVRAVLGDRKDPFRPAQLHRVPKTDGALSASNVATTVDAGSGSAASTSASGGGGATSGGGDQATSGGGDTAPAEPTATPAPKPVFDLYSLKVRFGSTEGELATRNVKRLTGLPGGTQPAALYLGLRESHKSAVFIIDAGVKVIGDGRCDPSPTDCQTLTLKEGETEFLTRGDKQWELDLIDIRVKKTTDAKAAKASRKTIAPDGRKKLRGLVSRVGNLRYYESTGDLKPVPAAKSSRRTAKTTSFTSTG